MYRVKKLLLFKGKIEFNLNPRVFCEIHNVIIY